MFVAWTGAFREPDTGTCCTAPKDSGGSVSTLLSVSVGIAPGT